ncbi:hypothetical protein ACUH96_00925 [Dermabacteraceae bacterium P13077]
MSKQSEQVTLVHPLFSGVTMTLPKERVSEWEEQGWKPEGQEEPKQAATKK